MFDLDRLRLLRELAHRGTMTAVADAVPAAKSTRTLPLLIAPGSITLP